MIKQRKLTISNFESELMGLAGAIPLSVQSNELYLLFDYSYPDKRNKLKSLEKSLNKIGMYQHIEIALTRSEELVRVGQYEEAEDVLLAVVKSLMQASGTWDKLEKRYSKHKAE